MDMAKLRGAVWLQTAKLRTYSSYFVLGKEYTLNPFEKQSHSVQESEFKLFISRVIGDSRCKLY